MLPQFGTMTEMGWLEADDATRFFMACTLSTAVKESAFAAKPNNLSKGSATTPPACTMDEASSSQASLFRIFGD
jgi:hypothetical protein